MCISKIHTTNKKNCFVENESEYEEDEEDQASPVALGEEEEVFRSHSVLLFNAYSMIV